MKDSQLDSKLVEHKEIDAVTDEREGTVKILYGEKRMTHNKKIVVSMDIGYSYSFGCLTPERLVMNLARYRCSI